MNTYDPRKARTVCLIGHAGDGKTTLADSLLWAAGVLSRRGSVDDGSSFMNYLPEERTRRHSVSTAICSFDWQDHTIHLLDAPGDPNFAGELDGAIAASEGAILVLSAQDDLKLDTERAFEQARVAGKTVVAVLNKMDLERADAAQRRAQLEETLGVRAALLQLPIFAGDGGFSSVSSEGAVYCGYVDLLADELVEFASDGSGGATQGPIPDSLAEASASARTAMIEAIVEADDRMLEKYLELGELSREELELTLAKGVRSGSLLPIVTTAAAVNIGVSPLLPLCVGLFRAPFEAAPWPAERGTESIEIEADDQAPVSAYVFKSVADRYAGMLSLCRVVSGTMRTDSVLQNARTGTKERISKMLALVGDATADVKIAGPGAIVAIPKLKDTRTGDSLCGEARVVTLRGPEMRKGMISFAVGAKEPSEEDRVFEALHRLDEEDPSLHLGRDARTGEFLLTGLGQLHIEVTLEKLRRLFKVEALLRPPKVPYQETLRGRAEHVEGKLKKQSGGRGQYAVCYLSVEPGPRGSGVEFLDEIVGGAIPRNYIPAVERGVREACERGIIAGYEVTDIRVHCIDGKFHSVDSSEMAFKTAGSLGLRAAFQQAQALLLEPLMKLCVTVPDAFVGEVMGNLNARRGRVLSVAAEGHHEVIEAEVPMSELLTYASDLTSMTGGQGACSMEFSKYEEVPKEIQEKLVAEFAAEHEGA